MNGEKPGYSPGQFGYIRYDNYIPEAVRAFPYSSYLTLPGWAGTDVYAAELAAKTNPATPHISLPVSIAEFRDLPRLLRSLGNWLIALGYGTRSLKGLSAKKILRESAEANLAVRFGWKPLISDVLKLMEFQSAVSRRVKELEALRDNGGFKRNVTLSTAENTDVVESTLLDWTPTAPILNARRTISSTRKVWGSIRWRPGWSGNLPDRDDDMRKLAIDLVLGLHAGQITRNVWNALPWTWLTDWFVDTGTFLDASNNSIAHRPFRVCIMTKVVRSVTFTNLHHASDGSPPPDWVGVDGTLGQTGLNAKVRIVPLIPTGPVAGIPFLGSGALSILGSLAILRGRSGYRN
jgi:hypothetical protein